MGRVTRFEDLRVWATARRLVTVVYDIARDSEMRTDWGLRNQVTRAAISVMSNIAEGFESGGNRNFIKYLRCAKGSAGEVRSQLYVALDLGYVDAHGFRKAFNLADQVIRQLANLIYSIKVSGPGSTSKASRRSGIAKRSP